MPVYRQPQGSFLTAEQPVEMHFHDEDEVWLVQEGGCTAFMVDRDGMRHEFELTAGDVWMVEAGVEHACQPHEGGVRIFPFYGSIPEGSHEPGHHYLHEEHYLPTLTVRKTPIDRYQRD